MTAISTATTGAVPDGVPSSRPDGLASGGADAQQEPVIAAVRAAALELLASLPERPQRLRLRAGGVDIDLDWRLPQAAAGAASAGPAATPGQLQTPPAAAADDGERADEAALYYICADTVGTFYHCPEPGAPPFVAEGATVRAGQQVGIVEAMKLMLPVEADRAGRVVAVLAGDGQAVEYGERLIALCPEE